MLNKQVIEEVAENGCYLNELHGYKCFVDLDGTNAKKYLENAGFTVVKNYDTGRNGLAITDCGIHLSTNGWLYKR